MPDALHYCRLACDQILHDYPDVNSLPPQKYGHATFNYQQGVLLSAMSLAWELTCDDRYLNYIRDWADAVQDANGHIRELNEWISRESLDFRQGGNVLLFLYNLDHDPHWLELAGWLVNSLSEYPVNRFGGYWHMKSTPNEMWLDGLFMLGPLLVKYAAASGKQRFKDLAINQAVLMYENMRDPLTGLLRHGWDPEHMAQWADKETGLSGEVWGRALGWFTAAVADMLDELEKESPERNKMVEIQNNIAESIIRYQSPEGRWYQVVDKWDQKGNWPENSCTALFIYAIAKGIRQGYINPEYMSSIQKAYARVIETLVSGENSSFQIGSLCAGTCIDEGTFEHYIQRPKTINGIHGMGPFIMMTAEMAKQHT